MHELRKDLHDVEGDEALTSDISGGLLCDMNDVIRASQQRAAGHLDIACEACATLGSYVYEYIRRIAGITARNVGRARNREVLSRKRGRVRKTNER